MNSPKKYLNFRNLYQLSVHIALLILLAEVLVLSGQNKKLKQQMSAGYEEFKKGDYFSLLDVRPLSGDNTVDTTKLRLIFLFTTTCPHCKKTFPVWKTIDSIARSATPDIGLTAICLDPKDISEELLLQSGINFAVSVSGDAREFMKRNKINTVPSIFIRSKNGRVQQLWKGEMFEKEIAKVVNAISENKQTQ